MTHTGCACRECFGLREHLESLGLSARGLTRAPGHQSRASLRVVTREQPEGVVPEQVLCDGSYTCICVVCRAEVQRRVERGVRPRLAA